MKQKEKKIKVKRAKPFAANLASTKMLEASGWTVGTVEQTIRTGVITFKRDLFNFVDLVAISPSRGILFVQATGGGNMGARALKIRDNPIYAIALAAGARIQVHDWVKVKNSKDRFCKILEITKEENV